MKTSIKEKIKKITGVSISEKWLAVAAIMVLAVLLLPLLRLAFYTTPWYDDYSYGRFVKGFVGEEGILKGAWDGAVYTVRTWWYCWQGTFSSIFMMTLVPIAFHEAYYYVGIIIILLFFTCACMVFVKTVSAHVLKATRAVQIMLAVLVTATLLELIYTAQQGIFWYNAAVHYTFMHGCLFFLLAAVIKLLYAKHTATVVVMTILTTALSVMCGGSNYVTSLQGMLALLTITGLAALVKNKRFLALLFPIAVYAVALYFNMSAPGNGARAASYTGYGPVKSILYSFKSAAENAWLFTGVPMLIILAWFVLIIWNTVKRMKFSFAWPGLVTLFSFCFYATGFTSSYYGMGTEGLSRTWVVVKFTYQLLLFLNTAYWLGWWMHRREKRRRWCRK